MSKRSGMIFIGNQPLLSSLQYKYWSSWCTGLSQAIIIGVLAARFIPPAVGLPEALDEVTFVLFLSGGLTIGWTGSILVRRSEEL